MDLIKIEKRDGKETVNARDLHGFLEVGKDFSTWFNDRVVKYGFEDGVDYTDLVSPSSGEKGGRPKIEYFISLDMAKELSMVENNEKGREARRYFIEVENKARQVSQNPLDLFRQSLAIFEQQQKQLDQQNARLDLLEAKATTSPVDYYTIAGFASLRGIKIDISKANILGRKAKLLSDQSGYETGKVSDPRFGAVNSYHVDILNQIF